MSEEATNIPSEETESKPFWSNCLIQAMKHHWKDPENVNFIVVEGPTRFHVMWEDKKEHKIRHFTRRNMKGKFCAWWFKGTIKNVEYDALKEWCAKNKVKFNVERP